MKNLLLTLVYKVFGYKTNGQYLKELRAKKILIISDHTYGWQSLQVDVYRGSEAKVHIGKYCSLSKNIRIITGGIHPVNWVSTFPFRSKFNLPGKFEDGMPYSKGDIVICNDVWIGTGVTILSGVRIGNGAVIAAGTIITKDVPDYAVVAGVPANVLKYRFTEIQIKSLQTLQWWNWDEAKVMENVPFLSSQNIDDFLKKHIN